MSVSQDLIYRRARYEREDHSRRVRSRFRSWLPLARKNHDMNEMLGEEDSDQTGFHCTGLSGGG